ncbi:AAA family ATPase [Rhodococcus hoagii]|nr:AAA family ATPase [Prescottella equi]
MRSIAMFNNKGGVGKTTLTCNLASFLVTERGKKVVVVDCDPQCNSTQLLLGVDMAAALYTGAGSKFSTISKILSPIDSGESDIDGDVTVFPSSDNRFNVDLIAGDPDFALTEDRLADAWKALTARDIQGFRRTSWNSALRRVLSDRGYDYAFYDIGPSLGSINRSVLAGCDNFLTPLSSDIFSIIGIRNIANWLTTWINDFNHSWEAVPVEKREQWQRQFPDIAPPVIGNGYVGYIVQQYITKSYGGNRRATKAYEDIRTMVPRQIQESLLPFIPTALRGDLDRLNLGDIPHLYSLVPLAQKNAVPISGLSSRDGLVGSQYNQQASFKSMIADVADAFIGNMDSAVVKK